MLNQLLIEKLASDLKIAPLNIIREYFEMKNLTKVCFLKKMNFHAS